MSDREVVRLVLHEVEVVPTEFEIRRREAAIRATMELGSHCAETAARHAENASKILLRASGAEDEVRTNARREAARLLRLSVESLTQVLREIEDRKVKNEVELSTDALHGSRG